MNRKAVAIQHVSFDGLGILKNVLFGRGSEVEVYHAYLDAVPEAEPLAILRARQRTGSDEQPVACHQLTK